jgi:hypothetical protein
MHTPARPGAGRGALTNYTGQPGGAASGTFFAGSGFETSALTSTNAALALRGEDSGIAASDAAGAYGARGTFHGAQGAGAGVGPGSPSQAGQGFDAAGSGAMFPHSFAASVALRHNGAAGSALSVPWCFCEQEEERAEMVVGMMNAHDTYQRSEWGEKRQGRGQRQRQRYGGRVCWLLADSGVLVWAQEYAGRIVLLCLRSRSLVAAIAMRIPELES